eukprot:15317096-Heterocapsa_arctica.AAC.1
MRRAPVSPRTGHRELDNVELASALADLPHAGWLPGQMYLPIAMPGPHSATPISAHMRCVLRPAYAV